jgi:hypothetical protein
VAVHSIASLLQNIPKDDTISYCSSDSSDSLISGVSLGVS